MKKKDIMKIVDNPNFIEGIFNYCDRWCERCPLTARCANFAIGEVHFSSPEDRDVNNARFWEKLHEVFQVTLEMVLEMAEEQGIDLSDMDLEETHERDEQLRQIARDQMCVQ